MSAATIERPVRIKSKPEFIHEIRIKSLDRLHVFLGRYDVGASPKGFIIEITPSTVSNQSVRAHITRLDSEYGTKFFLDVANNASRSVKLRIKHL